VEPGWPPGGRHNKVWIWDVARGQPIITLEGDVPQRNQSFGGFYWIDDDTLIAAGSDVIYWWNVTTGQLLKRLARPEQSAFFVDVAFSKNGERFAAAAQDRTIYFWDSKGSNWAIWPADPGSSVSKVAFSPDGRLLAAATYEGELLLWIINKQELLVSHSIPTDNIHSVRFSPDGRYIAVVGSNPVIWFWGIP